MAAWTPPRCGHGKSADLATPDLFKHRGPADLEVDLPGHGISERWSVAPIG
jgi:hypothetical protein